jgi:hypothetical protein
MDLTGHHDALTKPQQGIPARERARKKCSLQGSNLRPSRY